MKTLNLTGNTALLALNVSENTSITIKADQVIKGGFVRTNGVGISLTNYQAANFDTAYNYWEGRGFVICKQVTEVENNKSTLGALISELGFVNYLQDNISYWSNCFYYNNNYTFKSHNYLKSTDSSSSSAYKSDGSYKSFGYFSY